MPASEASCIVRGGSVMPICSHITNFRASAFVRTCGADFGSRRSHNQNMARRGTPKIQPLWYLPEWMAASNLAGRGAHTKMRELTGWSKATMSQLYNGGQDFNSRILQEAATALKCRPYELLMHPEEAFGLRHQRAAALQVVTTTPSNRSPEPADSSA